MTQNEVRMRNAIERILVVLPAGNPMSHAAAIVEGLKEEGYRALQPHPSGGKLLSFAYRNHRGDWHQYAIEVEGIEFTDRTGQHDDVARWMLHGMVVTRDGDARPEMGDNRRRSFILTQIIGMAEVERSR